MGSNVPPITPIRRMASGPSCPRIVPGLQLGSRWVSAGLSVGLPAGLSVGLPAGLSVGLLRGFSGASPGPTGRRSGYDRDMTSVPDRARVRLTGISSRAYEHPADRSALV